MNALLQVEFPDAKRASKALKILRTKELFDKSKAEMRVKGNVLLIEVEARSYAPLRARVTSVMREIKIVLDAVSIVGRK